MKKHIRKLSIILIFMIGILQILPAQEISDSIKSNNDTVDIRSVLSVDDDWDIIKNIKPPVIIPSSPQSQIFEKYVNHPTVESNGLPQISIPLYEIQLKGLTIPITLNYHASGIKFKQYDGDVGAGWSINVGGYRITQTVYGYADDTFYPMYDKEILNQYTANGRDNLTRDAYLTTIVDREITEYTNDFIDHLRQKNIPFLPKDSEYDIFTFMTPTSNGHYIIPDRNNSQVEILEKTLDKIADQGRFTQITDSEGNNFYFGGPRDSKRTGFYAEIGGDGRGNLTGSTLLISELETKHNDKAHFSYMSHLIDNTTGNRDHFTTFDAALILGYTNYSTSFSAGYDFENRLPNEYQIEMGFIQKIETDNEYIYFVRDTLNKEKPYLLKQIIIKSIKGDIIKKIELNQTTKKHLLLSEVSIGNSIKIEKKYILDYYDGPSSEKNIYTDQWGYYKQSNELDTNKDVYFHKEFGDDSFFFITNYSLGLKYEKRSLFDEFRNRNQRPALKDVYYRLLDRTPGEENPCYFSLKRIIFPAGGYEEYEYESHQYKEEDSDIVKQGGGLRIKKITSNPNMDGIPFISIYKYGRNEDGISITDRNIKKYRKLFVNETFLYILNQFMIPNPAIGHDVNNIQYIPVRRYMNYPSGESSPFDSFSYKYVSVYNKEGKTVTEYLSPELYTTEVNTATFDRSIGALYPEDIYIKEYKYGFDSRISQRIFFNNVNDTIKKEIYSYHNTDIKEFESLKIWQKIYASARCIKDAEGCGSRYLFTRRYLYEYATSMFKTQPYNILSGTRLLSGKKDITYVDNKAAVISTIFYEYNSRNQIDNISITYNQVNNSPRTLIKKLKYPQDFVSGNNIYQQMVDKNIVSPVIEQTVKHGEQETQRVRNEYMMDEDKTKGLILLGQTRTSSGEGKDLRTDITYDRYDNKGNILQYTTLDSISTTYLWSYNGQYPVAEIKNATYDQVKNALGKNPESLSSEKEPDITLINSLRDNPILKKSLITTYTYKPLVGIETITDPRGLVTTYKYDDFGRLEWIKDSEGNLVEEYKYNYRDK